jgi:cytochrome oxidase assembly protein ShyY1
MQFSKPPFWASLFCLIGVIILCSLGTWQAEKYLRKSKADPQCASLEAVLISDNFNDVLTHPYVKCRQDITFQGRILDDKMIALGPRVYDEEVGYHIYVILEDRNESHILVNLGWTQDKHPEFNYTDNVQITGILYQPSGANSFTPDNKPEAQEWYAIDWFEVKEYTQISDLMPYALWTKQMEPAVIQEFVPAEMSKTYLKPQTHLQYAAFWYFLMLAMITVFLMRFVIVKQKKT